MAKNTANYGNDSIRQLKDEERVRLRPAVIFGSDGLDGCAHAAFEILSNAVDEARQGYGKLITLTAFRDGSIQVEDNGRGCPLDWNPSEKRFNWELVFCELYAGGKYNNNQGGDYDFSLGTNGLGSCATQYASEYMDVTVWRDGNKGLERHVADAHLLAGGHGRGRRDHHHPSARRLGHHHQQDLQLLHRLQGRDRHDGSHGSYGQGDILDHRDLPGVIVGHDRAHRHVDGHRPCREPEPVSVD